MKKMMLSGLLICLFATQAHGFFAETSEQKAKKAIALVGELKRADAEYERVLVFNNSHRVGFDHLDRYVQYPPDVENALQIDRNSYIQLTLQQRMISSGLREGIKSCNCANAETIDEIKLRITKRIAELEKEVSALRCEPLLHWNHGIYEKGSLDILGLHPVIPVPQPIPFDWKLSSIGSKLWQWKFGVAFAGITLAYSTFLYKFFQMPQFLMDTHAWHAFKTQEAITSADLFAEIAIKYPAATAEDKSRAIEQFVQDVSQEMDQLKSFITWHARMKSLKLSAIVPNQRRELKLAQAKLNKLEYMVQLVQETGLLMPVA